MIEINTLADLESLREDFDIEAKQAVGPEGKGAIPKNFWDTYSSFANTRGGEIFLGVAEDENKRLVPVGLLDPEKLVKDLFDNLNNRQKTNVNLLSNEDVRIVEIDGKRIIQIHVPRASRKDRPVYIGSNPLKGTYRRQNEGDYLCTEEEVRRLMAERIEDSRDDRILKGYAMHDLNMQTFHEYRQIFANTHPIHPWNEVADQEFLRSIGGWKMDRETGESGLTLAGLLMFGTLPSILDALPNYFVDYQERPEPKAELRWVDRLTIDGSWSGNLFDFYRRVIRKLNSELKVPFALDGDSRQDDTLVHQALREALVNALVHADYSGRVSVLIVKRPDMFGFRNPGSMRVSVEQAIKGGESDCRNRKLHQMFLLIGLGERAGSGVPKIYTGWSSQHWRRPMLYEKDRPEQTLLELRMIDLLPPEVLSELEARFGDAYRKLSRLDRLIVATAAIESTVTHARLTEITSEHPHDLTQALQHLVKDGFLESSGRSRGTVYFIPGGRRPTPEEVFGPPTELASLNINTTGYADGSGGNGVGSGGNGVGSGGNGDSSGGNGDSSGGLDFSSGGLDFESGCIINSEEFEKPIVRSLDGLETDLIEFFETKATPATQKQRLKPEIMRQLIIELCSEHYLSLNVLSVLLSRNPDFLRKDYLNPMVGEGALKRAFPTRPNHPSQAYLTIKKAD